MNIFQVYKRSSIVVILLSLIHLLVFNFNTIGHGLWISLLVNAGFHMAYLFISRAPLSIVERARQMSPAIGNIYKAFSQLIGIIALIGSLGASGIVLYQSITTGEYEQLIVILAMAGLFLGGIKLFYNLDSEI